jgi:hypothetical protein
VRYVINYSACHAFGIYDSCMLCVYCDYSTYDERLSGEYVMVYVYTVRLQQATNTWCNTICTTDCATTQLFALAQPNYSHWYPLFF